jgi:hypothetical protein
LISLGLASWWIGVLWAIGEWLLEVVASDYSFYAFCAVVGVVMWSMGGSPF